MGFCITLFICLYPSFPEQKRDLQSNVAISVNKFPISVFSRWQMFTSSINPPFPSEQTALHFPCCNSPTIPLNDNSTLLHHILANKLCGELDPHREISILNVVSGCHSLLRSCLQGPNGRHKLHRNPLHSTLHLQWQNSVCSDMYHTVPC